MNKNENIEKQKEIKKAMKTARQGNNARMFQRYLTVFLYFKEKEIDEIAETAGISERTVYNYIAAYQRNGIEGLVPRKKSGAPHKLTEKQEAELKDVIINQYPSDCGFPIDYNWTSDLLCQYVNQTYQVHYSRSGMNLLLIRLGFSYTRATYVLAKADIEKQELFRVAFEDIKKNFFIMKLIIFYSKMNP